jgi:hypothetical protein
MHTPWQPIDDPSVRDRRNKLTVGLLTCNAIFCVISGVCWALGIQEHVKTDAYQYFYLGEIFIALAYIVNAWYSRDVVRGIVETLDPVYPEVSAGQSELIPPTVPGLSFSLKAIGAINAALVGFLTYYTGGPSNSPYAQVLVAMLLIAEQTHRVKGQYHNNRLRSIIRVCIHKYRWFFTLTFAFYAFLWYFQTHDPIEISTAPAEASALITLVIFLVGSVATYINSTPP